MAGFTLDTRQTSQLADIVAALQQPTDDPVPWLVLQQIKELVHADEVSFSGFDTVLEHVWFMQAIEACGDQSHDGETVVEARGNPFWDDYWEKSCSYPDRTGDFDSVTKGTDFVDPATLRRTMPRDHPVAELRACIRGRSPGRHYRLLAWRLTGPDFSERDRFFLMLLRPHLDLAYWSGIAARQEPPDLTRRQLQIMRLVQQGCTNLQIAHRLRLSEGTVRTHLNNIYARLGVTGRGAAVLEVFGASEHWPGTG